jgi:hypothetical protein
MENTRPKSFEDYAAAIRPEAGRAMILLEECSQEANQAKALAILGRLGAEPLAVDVLRSAYPAVILIRVPGEYVRQAVLKLTGSGFNKLKAVDPLPEKGRRSTPGRSENHE